MSREIKFRVWDGEKFLYTDYYSLAVDQGGWPFLKFNLTGHFKFPGLRVTVQQWTGLRDKNHKDIYEGDIIRFLGRWDENGNVLEPDNEPHEVKWAGAGLAAFKVNVANPYSSIREHGDVCSVEHTDCETVGNIFENSDEEELSKCESCDEETWDGYICHSCGHKNI